MKINDLQNSTSNNRPPGGGRKEKQTPSANEMETKTNNRTKKKHVAEEIEVENFKEDTSASASSGIQEIQPVEEPSQSEEKAAVVDHPQETKSKSRRKTKGNNGKQQSWKDLKSSLKTAQTYETKETIDSDDISSTTTEESTADSEHVDRGKRQVSVFHINYFRQPLLLPSLFAPKGKRKEDKRKQEDNIDLYKTMIMTFRFLCFALQSITSRIIGYQLIGDRVKVVDIVADIVSIPSGDV